MEGMLREAEEEEPEGMPTPQQIAAMQAEIQVITRSLLPLY
jgi:hypothetical protein